MKVGSFHLATLVILLLASLSTTWCFQAVSETVPADFTYPRGYQRRILGELRAGRLAGQVRATRGALINGRVLVEIINNNTGEKRIEARFTNSQGYFDFGNLKLSKRVLLKISMPGFDTMFVPVLLDKKVSHVLSLELQPST
jgi:hypothetical protein